MDGGRAPNGIGHLMILVSSYTDVVLALSNKVNPG